MFLFIKSRYINYEIEFNRKVTIIQGDSGTGKTKIVETIKELDSNGMASMFTSNGLKVYILERTSTWETSIKNSVNTLFLIDEECSWILSKDFAELVHKSDNYFIIISRDPIKSLNYSYEEIYEMKNSGKFNRTVRKYKLDKFNKLDKECEIILIEDSNSGFEFYKAHIGVNVESTNGKTRIKSILVNKIQNGIEKIGIIADGAAFGNEISRIKSVCESVEGIKVSWFLPDCVEGFIVNSGLLNFQGLINELKKLNKNKYISYEDMYCELVHEYTVGTPAQYSKSGINTCYISHCCHKSCPPCKLYKNVDKKTIVNELVFGSERNTRNDKLLF